MRPGALRSQGSDSFRFSGWANQLEQRQPKANLVAQRFSGLAFRGAIVVLGFGDPFAPCRNVPAQADSLIELIVSRHDEQVPVAVVVRCPAGVRAEKGCSRRDTAEIRRRLLAGADAFLLTR